jgi:2-amino-4-hydroxy-6-hydroxymethyldihydropteridine diphosphokinase
MPRAIISLGSNIDKEHNLPRAVALMAAATNVLAVSSVYETIPVGLRDQPNFFNAAVLIETDDTPAQLKAGLLTDIERELKRVRQADKNAPRTIDLDISWYDNASLTYDGPDGRPRRVPDPDLLRFAHVALPLTELLAASTTHPDTGEPVQVIAERLHRAAVIDVAPTIWRRDDIDLTTLVSALVRPATG